MEEYPTMEAVMERAFADPEVARIVRDAAAEGWTPLQLREALSLTDWWIREKFHLVDRVK